MKKSLTLLLCLALALSAAACSHAPSQPSVSQESTAAPEPAPEAATPAEAPETMPEPALEPTPEPEPTQEPDRTPLAYAAYLEILREPETAAAIRAYTWQYGTDAGPDPAPIAVCDILGDDVPELIFAYSAMDDIVAGLRVYTYGDGGAVLVHDNDRLAAEVAAGEYFCFYQLEEDKEMYNAFSGNTTGYERYEYADGALSPADHLADETSSDGSYLYFQRDGQEIDLSEYERQAEEYPKDAVRILLYNGFYSDYFDPITSLSMITDGEDLPCVALSYDDAVALLAGPDDDAAPSPDGEAFDFSVLPDSFYFSSGAGGWATDLFVAADGSFTGTYHDSDMGDTGDGYPYGTVYISEFSGRFSAPTRVNEYTWSTELEELEVYGAAGDTWIEDDIRYIYSDPYGLDDPGEFLIYLPGTPRSMVTEDFILWSHYQLGDGDAYPDNFYGIYNVNAGEGFVGEK